MEELDRPAASPPRWKRVLGAVGIVAHLGVGYLYAAAGLVVPWPALAVFLLVWVALLALAVSLNRRRPLLTLAAPFVALALLVGGVALGGAVLGWSA